MKVLQITAEGLPLFREKLSIPLYATHRVYDPDMETLYKDSSNLYLNCANAFVGINASGKTSVLKAMVLAMELLECAPVNHVESKVILGNSKEVVFNIYFSASNELCRLETHICAEYDEIGNLRYKISEEKLWVKKIRASATSKKSVLDFSSVEPKLIRSELQETLNFLSDDVSMVIAYLRPQKERVYLTQMLFLTNINYIPYNFGMIPKEVIEYLDSSVDYIKIEKKGAQDETIRIKFKGKKEIAVKERTDMVNYLSSGTIKGINVFLAALAVINTGGYLVIDEIENHFNKEIVSSLIRFFMNKNVNPKGAVLIYSTHYPELLDEHCRNDSVFITLKENGIKVKSLASSSKRNDVSKSDLIQSGSVEKTAPSYTAYLALKNLFLGLRK